MGADLIVTVVPWPRRADGTDYEQDALFERIERDIQTIGPETLALAANVIDLDEEDDADVEPIDALRQALTAAARSCIGCQDIIEAEVRGVRVIIAGGMSWGESPSVGYDALTLLAECRLLDDDPPDHWGGSQ